MMAQKYIIGYTTMKPEDFILNSDYIALSTATITTKQVNFGGGTIAALDHASQVVNLAVPKIEEAEFQYMISTDGEKWSPVGLFEFNYDSSIMGVVIASRTDAATVQVSLLAANHTESSANYSAKTFWVKEAAIIAPDME